MSDYKKRKEERTLNYLRFEYKKKLKICYSCNGSGYYDSFNSPKCGSCGGLGKVRED